MVPLILRLCSLVCLGLVFACSTDGDPSKGSTEDTQPEDSDVAPDTDVAPPVDDTDAPPVDDTDTPPADDTDAPPVDDTDTPPADDTDVAIDTDLPPPPVDVEVRAFDHESDTPLVGATVRANGLEALTDATGLAVLQVPAGPYTVELLAAGYPDARVEGTTTAGPLQVRRSLQTVVDALRAGARLPVVPSGGAVRVDVLRLDGAALVPYDGVEVSLDVPGTPVVPDPNYARGVRTHGVAHREGEATVRFFEVPDGPLTVSVDAPAGVTCPGVSTTAVAGFETLVTVVCDATQAEPRYAIHNRWYKAPLSAVPTAAPPARWPAQEGRPVPNIRFYDQNDDPVDLRQFSGQTVLLDIGETWCNPCMDQAPMIDDLRERYNGVPLQVLQVLNDADARQLRDWSRAYQTSLPTLRPHPADIAVLEDAHDGLYPRKVVISPDGVLLNEDFGQNFDLVPLMVGGEELAQEDCEDGWDNDRDMMPDCLDDTCLAHPACGLSVEIEGDIAPCATVNDGGGGDVYQVEVPGPTVRVEIDTVTANTAFDPRVRGPLREEAVSPMFTHYYADDELPCSFAPLAGACPRGIIAPGSRQILVNAGYGTDNLDGGCQRRALGRYVIRLYGEASLTLLQDNVPVRPIIP